MASRRAAGESPVSAAIEGWCQRGLLLYFQSWLQTSADDYGMLADVRFAVERLNNLTIVFTLANDDAESDHRALGGEWPYLTLWD